MKPERGRDHALLGANRNPEGFQVALAHCCDACDQLLNEIGCIHIHTCAAKNCDCNSTSIGSYKHVACILVHMLCVIGQTKWDST